MRRDLAAAARLLVLPTLALVVVAAFLPGRLDLALRVYALILSVAALAICLSALRRAYPPATPLLTNSRDSDRRREAPATLARLEHETALGVGGAFDLHHRLRPRLRALAVGLVAVRRRISLDADPEAGRRAVGDEAWELVRKDRPPPADRLARGIPAADLARVVDSLERV